MTKRIVLEPKDVVKVAGKAYFVCDHVFEGDVKITILVKGRGAVTIDRGLVDNGSFK